MASPDGAQGSTRIHQDARLYAARLGAGDCLSMPLLATRLAYVHVVSGTLALNGLALQGGDGVKIAAEEQLTFTAAAASEVLLFDLPPAQ